MHESFGRITTPEELFRDAAKDGGRSRISVDSNGNSAEYESRVYIASPALCAAKAFLVVVID
jgi:hypothetical protein